MGYSLAAHNWPGGKQLSALAIVAAVLVAVGLSQRVIETAVLSWVMLCGLYINRQI